MGFLPISICSGFGGGNFTPSALYGLVQQVLPLLYPRGIVQNRDLRGTVSKDFRDIFHRHALGQQVGGECVPELVGIGPCHARQFEQLPQVVLIIADYRLWLGLASREEERGSRGHCIQRGHHVRWQRQAYMDILLLRAKGESAVRDFDPFQINRVADTEAAVQHQ
jgi:hypothetical protein